jgi:BolA family transcriptional regulator, general stress-responsive regulator
MNKQRIALIRSRLAVLKPRSLDIIDESAKHIGHAGSKSGAGHFEISIGADVFANQPLVKCHRMIYEALGDLLPTEIHAIRIKIVKE